MTNIPTEIVHKILLLREKHDVAKLLCCRICDNDYGWHYPLLYKDNEYKIGYFYILCSDCLHDYRKG